MTVIAVIIILLQLLTWSEIAAMRRDVRRLRP